MTWDRERDLAAPPDDDELERRRVIAEAEARLFGDARAPVRIGRFEVRGKLGAGGFGVVYAAHDPTLDRPVALKLMRADRARPTDADQERMLREARAMARLAHPNVVTVHEVGIEDGRVFVAMELVAGRTLRRWLAEARPAWSEIVAVFLDAGRGLAAAHAAGLVHRDFKPDNVLVGNDGRIRVGDFGLARPYPPEPAAGLPAGSPATAGTVAGAGTPAYMAPEQHAGRPATAAADQFAFCVALYEALYEARPFTGERAEELAAAKGLGYVAEPASTGVPRRIWDVVRRGLAPQAADRWPSMDRLLDALENPPRRRALRLFGIGVVTLILGVALLGAIMQMWMMMNWTRGR